MATSPKPTQAEPVVQLYRNVIERLNGDVRKAFEANPPQGAEIGGLLLGTLNLPAGSIEIQDYEALSCEARSDGRFIISGFERDKLENALRQRGSQRRVVGCYRSHISPALTLGVDDFAFAQVCLRESGGVFLLIPPSPEGTLKAGFFLWQDGQIDSKFSFHECSFDTQKREVTQPPLPSFQPASRAKPIGVAALGNRPGGSPIALPQRPRVEKRNVFSRLGHAFSLHADVAVWRAKALGGFSALVSLARAIRWRTRGRGPWKAMVARPLYPVLALSIAAVCMMAYMAWPRLKNFERPAGSTELELQVDRLEGNLRVNWNQNAPMLQRAQGAVLTIRDGDSPPVELQLEPEQLHNGRIVYSPKTANVQFSLEIIAPDGMRTTESVTTLAPHRHMDSTRVTVARKPLPAGQAARDRRTLSPLESKREFTREKSVGMVPPNTQVPSPSPQTPVAGEKVDPPSSNPPAARTTEVAVSPAYVPPRALHESRPALSAAIRAMMTSEVELQVKVKIDDSGSVTRADTLSASGPATRSLVDLTEQAARLWKFAPAIRGAAPVPSEAIVVFKFRPSEE